MPTSVLSLFHAPCGGRVSRVRGVKPGAWMDALLTVGRDMESKGVRCRRCGTRVSFAELLPSVDDEGFVPVRKPDESGLVGYGAEQDARPGAKF